MLDPWFDLQRSWFSAWSQLVRLGDVSAALARLAHAPRELVVRTLAASDTHGRTLEEVVRADAPFRVRGRVIAATPFVRLVHLVRPEPPNRRFLLLAPASGYATVVLSPLATALAAQGEVVVTDWIDARLIPAAEGGFGLRDQVEAALAAAIALDGPAHIVALSQSGPAALALVALLAQRAPELLPASLTFLGCQLDPSASRLALPLLMAPWPREMLVRQLTAPVPPGYPGTGRLVYPALLQLLSYSLASPQLYAEVQQGLLRELATGRLGEYERMHTDIHSLADVPAELFADMLDWMLTDNPWDEEAPRMLGAPIDLAPLRDLPVLTVEASQDELIGQGQTHGLARRLSLSLAHAATLAGGRHHDLFTGPRFFGEVAPLLWRFFAARTA